MEDFYGLFSDHSLWVALGAAVVSVLCIGFALYYLLVGAALDEARRRVIQLVGTPVELLVLGGVLVLIFGISPSYCSVDVVQPTHYGVDDNCYPLLKNQLIFQRGATTAKEMNEIIGQIQSARDACSPDIWNPEVDDSVSGAYAGGCFHAVTPSGVPEGDPVAGDLTVPDWNPMVGDLTVPDGLLDESLGEGVVRATSGRDSENNIIVCWSAQVSKRPLDGSLCWLYVSRLNTWDESH